MLEELFSSFDAFVEDEVVALPSAEVPFWISFTCAGAGNGACEVPAAPFFELGAAAAEPVAASADWVEPVDPLDEVGAVVPAAVPIFGVNSPMLGSLPAGAFVAGDVETGGAVAGSLCCGGAAVAGESERGMGSLAF